MKMGFLPILAGIMIPALAIMVCVIYPKNWKKKRFVLGVKNRSEFRQGEAEAEVSGLLARARRFAVILIVSYSAINLLLFLLRNEAKQFIIWYYLTLAALILVNVPYWRGNGELKALKKRLGIEKKTGVKVVDVKSITASHALNKAQMVIPAVLAVLFLGLTLLFEKGILHFGSEAGRRYAGSYIVFEMVGALTLIAVILVPLAIMIDNARSQIVSENSGENVNYNRAVKKVWADFSVFVSWSTLAAAILGAAGVWVLGSEIPGMIMLGVFLVLIFAMLFVLMRKLSVLSSRYADETPYDMDEDDNWLLGMFYYNPSDRRLNVSRRTDTGFTINLAHPAGKVITAIIAIALAAVITAMTIGIKTMDSPLQVRLSEGTVICHQLKDEYKIDLDDIREMEYGDDMSGLKKSKVAGYNTQSVLKGTFLVNGEKGCRVFMDPGQKEYIRIKTDSCTYYINASTAEETRALYEEILSNR